MDQALLAARDANANANADTDADTDALTAALAAIVGRPNVHDDAARRGLFSHDIWAAGEHTAGLVVAPDTVAELAQVVAAAHRAGWSVAPRGGGMSYTAGYVPADGRTLALDMARMDRIVAIRAADMTVTVQAGCTWAALHEALSLQGLRTPFWGPMSGLMSTVGGGLSQLNAMLGAGHHGTSSESVVALTVVLADGRVLRTGASYPGHPGGTGNADGADGPNSANSPSSSNNPTGPPGPADPAGDTPFYRHYGPDLAGLFCGDCGVFGVKAEITLRLIRKPAHEAYASFAFKTGRALLAAMAEIARAGVASETCAFDPGLTRVRMQRASLASDIKTLGAVVSKQKSLMKGLVEAGRIALAGRDFIDDDTYPLHVIAEGRSAAAAQGDIGEARRIAVAQGGHEIENSVAKIIRAQPFPPLNSVLGPAGQRWVPIHGIAALSQAAAVFDAVQAVFAQMAGELDRAGVQTAYLFTHLSTNALIVEPVFYWPGAPMPIHAVAMEPAHRAQLPVLPDHPQARAAVVAARAKVVEVFQRFGCGHFQIGRSYPYRASRDTASWNLLNAVKQALDPQRALNPGGLGLDAAAH